MTTYGGYTNRLILLEFPELADGCSVLIRNPALMPPEKLEAVNADDQDNKGLYEVIANLVVAWRNVFAPDDVADLDDGEIPLDELMARLESVEPVPLGKPSPETVPLLPMAVINRIAEEISNLNNPK